MLKSDIVNALCDRGYYKNQAGDVVDDIFDIMYDAIVSGQKVMIRGFGTFELKNRKGRKSVNISTGEVMVSRDYKSLVFKPSTAMKAEIVENTKPDRWGK